ncbi:hypothetical protein [Sphingomonas xinjiangensis]|uniref:Uncharacterized protein n=1 Tax=Sphingomonas xinjiangensis TaxID=643568 RepID=A0A840YM80_9SPHN|nr:hypothetical protein [Sphingomonas xinjiangensis]MBB5710836.1 hypothetical protein [Sphingomonas xinjiangensis]
MFDDDVIRKMKSAMALTTEVRREKMKAVTTLKMQDPTERQKRSTALKGRPKSDATRAKMSKPKTAEHKAAIAATKRATKLAREAAKTEQ